MDKKFYYKTPALVAMTLAGTTLVSHQVNAEEQTTNKENKNIIEQHDNASQIQDEQKELKSQSLNVSGTKEYKDPSIIDEPKQEVENTADVSVQPTSNEDEQNSDVASTEDNTEVTNNEDVSEDTAQTASNEEEQNSDVASSEDNTEVTNNQEASEDTTQPTSNEDEQNSDVASTEDNTEVTNNQEVSEDTTQPTSNNEEQNTDVAPTEDNSDVTNNEEVSDDSVQPTSNEEEQNSDVAPTEDNTEVTNNQEASEDTTQTTSNEDEQNTDVTPTEDNTEVTNNEEVSEDTTHSTSNEEEQNSDVASTEDNAEVTNNQEASEDSAQPTSNEEEQNSDVASTEDNTEVTNNQEASEDTTQPTSNEEDQDTEVASSEDNTEVTNNEKVSEDTNQTTSNEDDQNSEVASTEDYTEVANNEEVSEDTTQTTSTKDAQNTEAANSTQNDKFQLETTSVQPRVSTFAFRSVSSAPVVKKAVATTSSYSPTVSSSINSQIRNNNYAVPTYVEDFSSHIPKIPYRNGVGKPEGIIAHETANPNSTIQGEIAYMKNNYESAFVHAFVDDNNIIEVAPTDYLAWGAGGVANERFIHVELVRVYGGDRFARSINNYADYIATNLSYYGLPFDSAENDGTGTLWSHDAVSRYLGGTDHSDPYGWFAENNYTFNELVDLVREKYLYKTGSVTQPTTPVVSKPKPTTPVVSKPKPTTPVTSKPKTSTPVVSKPKTTTPVTSKPKTSTPVVSKPKTTTPVVSKPKTTTPVASKPKTTTPVASPAKTVVVNYKGKVNTNASGVYSSVYDTKTKSAANKVGKTFNIGKQSNYNNQVYYLLQDNNGTPLGWVKSSDIQLQNNTKATSKPVASNAAKPKATPKPVASNTVKPKATPKPVASNTAKPKATSKPVASKTTKANAVAKTVRVNYLGKVNKNISGVYTSVYDQKTVPAINKAGKTFKIGKQSTYNNQTYYLLQDNNAIPLGWVNAKDIQLQKVTTQPTVVNKPTVAQPKKTNAIKSSAVNNQPIVLKENYQNYLIFDNSGYFYSEPSVSKKTLLGSLQNYQYSYFKVITSQKVGNELWYKGLLNGKTVWINAKYLQLATESTNISTSPYTLDQAVDIQMALRNGSEPKKVLASGIRNATRAEVKDAMDTSKYVNDPVQKYQFLDLNKSQNISVTKLNDLLRGKGILENQGSAFSQAAKAVGINEIYLISHALLETGNGTSDLANGGAIDQNGKVDLNAQTKYYNMFGVGAIDKNALYGGIKYAQQAGWNTPEKAILGGAQFIANNYIKSGQNTLYKMRFNPQNPGVHQYATGIDFAKSNAKRISDFYQQIQTDGQYYDVDQYKA